MAAPELIKHYNFVRTRQTLKITPVMAAGVAANLGMSDLVAVLEEWKTAQ